MSILALVTKTEDVGLLIPWAHQFAKARETNLTVLCWADSPNVQYPLLSDQAGLTDGIVSAVESIVKQNESSEPLSDECSFVVKVDIRRALHPSATTAAMGQIHTDYPELVVAVGQDTSGKTGATYATNTLLRQSPSNTLILFGGSERSAQMRRVLVAIADSGHDVAAVSLAARLDEKCHLKVAIARGGKWI